MNNTRCKGCGEEKEVTVGYCDTCGTQPVFVAFGTRYTRMALSEAFDWVKDQTNWKNPIDCTLRGVTTAVDRQLIAAAITFYAGCTATFTGTKQGLRVQAVGYYRAVGA